MKTSNDVVFDGDPADGGACPPERFAERAGTLRTLARHFQETGKPTGRGVGPLDCGDVVQWLVARNLMDGAIKLLDIEAAPFGCFRFTATAEVLE